MAVQTAVTRGQFEMSCPTATGTVLSKEVIQPPMRGPWVGGVQRAEYTVGVSGCDKRMVFTVICPDGGDGLLRRGPRQIDGGSCGAHRYHTRSRRVPQRRCVVTLHGGIARMIRAILAGMAALWMGLGVGAPSALAQPPFQAPPVLSARELLPRDMLAGPHFQVEDRVPTDGLLGHFTLRSGFGTFVAPGRELLRIRIAELAAIQHLEATSQTDVFLQAAGRAAEKPVEAVESLITDPVDTIQGIPAGISRFFDRVELGAKRIEQSASDPTKSEQQRVQESAQRIGSATITALGFEQVRRQLAKGLAVDPYTTNPVLSKKLTDTAWVAFSGRLGVNLLVSAFVPGSTAISGLSFTHDLVYDTPAADLIVLNAKRWSRWARATRRRRRSSATGGSRCRS